MQSSAALGPAASAGHTVAPLQQGLTPAQLHAQKRAQHFQASLAGHDAAAFKAPVKPSLTHFTPLARDQPPPKPFSHDEAQRVKGWLEQDVQIEQQLQRDAKAAQARLVSLAQSQALERPQDWIGPFDDHPPPPQVAQQSQRLIFKEDHIKARASGKRGRLRAALGWEVSSHQNQRAPNGRGQMSQQHQQQQPQHFGVPEWQTRQQELEHIAEEPEILIPIRIDAEHEGVKLRDVFTWNLKDTTASSRVFVQHLLADMQIPHNVHTLFFNEVVKQIDDQLSEPPAAAFHDAVHSTFRADHIKQMDEDDSWLLFEPAPLTTDDLATAASAAESSSAKNEELRILIKLDITLDTLNLTDTIEWDLSDAANSPEDFAHSLCHDLGLPGEFVTAVAHSIREQVEAHIKSLSLVAHTLGMPITNDELKSSFLAPLTAPAAVRALHAVSDFTPELNRLSVDDLERNLAMRDRESRRKRRNTRGRQRVNLPDREPLKTSRTLVPRPGGRPPVLVAHQPQQRDDDDDEDDAYIDPEEKADSGKLRLSDFDVSRPFKLRRVTPSAPRFQANVDDGPSSMELDAPKRKNNRGRHKQLAAAANAAAAASAASSPGGPSSTNHVDYAKFGQHPNWIDGKWHCANCGGPDDVVPGRRKGPAGEKSVCGACGKHWMRYKKNRPCEYTTSAEKHWAMLQADDGENLPKPRGRPPAVAASPPRPLPRPQTPLSDLSDIDGDYPLASTSKPEPAPAVPPAAPAPVAEAAATAPPPPPPPPPPQQHQQQPQQTSTQPALPPTTTAAPIDDDAPPKGTTSAPPPPRPASSKSAAAPLGRSNSQSGGSGSKSVKATPPTWLLEAANELRGTHPDDRFEIISRQSKTNPGGEVEWRIRCHDCPGKIYTPGPGESLQNFNIHVANRGHRANVNARVEKEGKPS